MSDTRAPGGDADSTTAAQRRHPEPQAIVAVAPRRRISRGRIREERTMCSEFALLQQILASEPL